MKTRTLLRLLLLIPLWNGPLEFVNCQDRPNILWITAEDMSAALGCYGDSYATTPHLDEFASESVRYTHAFATAPVCSPSRNCLITGIYPTQLGTHNMRSAFPLPESVVGFPQLLRKAGYYTTNNVKTDYNTGDAERLIRDSWDDSSATAHWRSRPESAKPFFSVFNLMVSHQSRSMVWPYDQFVIEVQSQLGPSQIHDPDEVPLPPYYPDTPVVRRDLARFHDCVTVMDMQVGRILAELEADGLAENTIVFFFSDHGSGMPRHKRMLFDSGMHVPLMIRFPQQYQSLSRHVAGAVADELVSFIDFPPTALTIAGLPLPAYMQGIPFVGKSGSNRTYVIGHRDRIDEVFDTARSVRNGRYLYIRNFMPHLGCNQPSAWPNASEIDGEFRNQSADEGAKPAILQYVSETRPVEEFYDCENDPYNLNNLVSDPGAAQETLQEMRLQLLTHMLNTGDRGVIPESILFRDRDLYRQTALKPQADVNVAHALAAALNSATTDETGLQKQIVDAQPEVRYWGAIGFCSLQTVTDASRIMLEQLLDDKVAAVRIAAADAMTRHGGLESALPVLQAALEDKDLNVVLSAMRTIELIGEPADPLLDDVRRLAEKCELAAGAPGQATFDQSGEQDLLMFIGFSTSAFLDGLVKAVD